MNAHQRIRRLSQEGITPLAMAAIFGVDIAVVNRLLNDPAAGDELPGSSSQTTFVHGTGPPTAGDGHDGDSYIDGDTLNVYGPKAGGQWPADPAATIGATSESGTIGDPIARSLAPEEIDAWIFPVDDTGPVEVRYTIVAACHEDQSSAKCALATSPTGDDNDPDLVLLDTFGTATEITDAAGVSQQTVNGAIAGIVPAGWQYKLYVITAGDDAVLNVTSGYEQTLAGGETPAGGSFDLTDPLDIPGGILEGEWNAPDTAGPVFISIPVLVAAQAEGDDAEVTLAISATASDDDALTVDAFRVRSTEGPIVLHTCLKAFVPPGSSYKLAATTDATGAVAVAGSAVEQPLG